eukprot:3803333-Rhodomonas_salina.1
MAVNASARGQREDCIRDKALRPGSRRSRAGQAHDGHARCSKRAESMPAEVVQHRCMFRLRGDAELCWSSTSAPKLAQTHEEEKRGRGFSTPLIRTRPARSKLAAVCVTV